MGTLKEFVEKHSLKLVIDVKDDLWQCYIHEGYVQEKRLAYLKGKGRTMSDAIKEYIKQIQGKRMILFPAAARKEIIVPEYFKQSQR